MVRARTLKPSIFKNELLGAADPAYTIVFQALWCMADRDGRLEDRPLRIHVEAMPLRDKALTEQSLGWLDANGFIVRYSAEGGDYIQVVKFKDHQNPHPREKESVIPQYVSDEATPRRVQGNAKALPSNALSSFPSPLSSSPIPAPKRGRARNRASQLPDDWKPEPIDGTPSDMDIHAEGEKFRDHWKSVGESRSDWDATWRNWVRRAAEGRYAKRKANCDSEWERAREEGKRAGFREPYPYETPSSYRTAMRMSQ